MFFSEKAIALAILRLIEIEKAVVEGSGVVGLAALMDGLLPELAGKKLVTLLAQPSSSLPLPQL